MPPAPTRIVLPTPFPVGPVNVWLLPGEPLTLIDAGPRTPEAMAALEQGLADAGLTFADLELLVLTHQHSDHVGQAGLVQQRSGCRVAAPGSIAGFLADIDEALIAEEDYQEAVMRLHGLPPERREAFLEVARGRRGYAGPVTVDEPFGEGDVVVAGGRRLEARERPGHSASDTILVDLDDRRTFGGDHLLGHISSNPLVHRPPAGPADPRHRVSALGSYLDSLERTAADDLATVHPGHGADVDDHRPLVAERVRMHRRRIEQVATALAAGPRQAVAISDQLWSDLPPSQTYLALSEVLGALDVLEREGRAQAADDGETLTYALV